jgi:hypothetical protein
MHILAASSISPALAFWGTVLGALATVAAATIVAFMSRRATREDHWSKQRELDQTAFTRITDAQGSQIKDLQTLGQEQGRKMAELDSRVEYQQNLLDIAVQYISKLRDIIRGQGLSAPDVPRELRARPWRERNR